MTRRLVEQAQQGDHAAFDALAAASFERLGGVARGILRDPSLAEDAVQECLVRAWRDLRALRDPDRFEAWTYRLLVNACADELRRARRRPIEVSVPIGDSVRSADATAAIDDRDELERGFGRLSVDHRAVLVLIHYVGLPAREVADVLGVPEGTVTSRLHYGTRALRASLEADRRSSLAVERAGRGA